MANEAPSKFTDDLNAALTVAVADVLQKFGLHFPDAREDEGWTIDMVSEFADLMAKQVDAIKPRMEAA